MMVNETYFNKPPAGALPAGMGCVFDSGHCFDCNCLFLDGDSLVWGFDFHGAADWRTRGSAASVHTVGVFKASVAAASFIRSCRRVRGIFRLQISLRHIFMNELRIEQADAPGWVVYFSSSEPPVLLGKHHWVGVDFDGTLACNDNIGHSQPPYPLGKPIPAMLARVKSLLAAGIIVKIFTARACAPQFIPIIQNWTGRNGLGRLEVTNQKDFNLIRFYDDRAIHF